MSRIGVVTVTHNSAEVLPEFLESVWNQTHQDFLLIVVDSGSTDPTLQLLSEVPDGRLRVIDPGSNVGFAVGSNLGIRRALEEQCDAILLLNNDTTFGPELFTQLLAGLDQYACDMTTPKMLYHSEPNRIWAAGGHLNRWFAFRNTHTGENRRDVGQFDQPHRVNFTPFCCVLMRSEVFQKIGYLDETYFVYVEDVDYCLRALKAGLRLWYLPQCRLFHKVSSLTGGGAAEFTVRFCTRNRMYFLRKHMPAPGAYIAYWLYRLYYLLDFSLGRTSKSCWLLRKKSSQEGWNLLRDAKSK